MNQVDVYYQSLVKKIMLKGEVRDDRTGVGTRAIFSETLKVDLEEGFPIVSLKYTHFKSVATEICWMLRGESNTKFLRDHGVTIWDEWVKKDGSLGPVYGVQWRRWCPIDPIEDDVDQIAELIKGLRENPHGRRHLITAWQPAELNNMALPPCHYAAQFYVDKDYRLHCMFHMRSVDVFLGLPFNLAGYALLTHILANALKFQVGSLTWTGGDVHLYSNHNQQIAELLRREIDWHRHAKLVIKPEIQIEDILENRLDPAQFHLENYVHDGKIEAPVAI